MKNSDFCAPIQSNSQRLARSDTIKRRKIFGIPKSAITVSIGCVMIVAILFGLRPSNTYEAILTSSRSYPKPFQKIIAANSGGSKQEIVQTVQKPIQRSNKAANVPNCIPVNPTSKPNAPDANIEINGVNQTPTTKIYYTVYGNNESQISSQLHSCSPLKSGSDHFAASSEYSINWAFTYKQNELGLCTISKATVGLSVLEKYPSWVNLNNDPALQNKWNLFMANLIEHEEGHARLDRQYAEKIHSDLLLLPAQSCDTITATAYSKANARVNELNRAHDTYDNDTDHGHTQGAVL
jgi:predicted secreted Zn-dependent protease